MRFPPLWKISHQVEFNSDMNEHIITTYSGAHAAAAREAINPDRWNNFIGLINITQCCVVIVEQQKNKK